MNEKKNRVHGAAGERQGSGRSGSGVDHFLFFGRQSSIRADIPANPHTKMRRIQLAGFREVQTSRHTPGRSSILYWQLHNGSYTPVGYFSEANTVIDRYASVWHVRTPVGSMNGSGVRRLYRSFNPFLNTCMSFTTQVYHVGHPGMAGTLNT